VCSEDGEVVMMYVNQSIYELDDISSLNALIVSLAEKNYHIQRCTKYITDMINLTKSD